MMIAMVSLEKSGAVDCEGGDAQDDDAGVAAAVIAVSAVATMMTVVTWRQP